MGAKSTKQSPQASPLMGPNGFAVVAQIGYVEFSAIGEHSPVEAAMLLIGKHGAEGEYRFPHEDGGEWVIDMRHNEMRESEPEW